MSTPGPVQALAGTLLTLLVAALSYHLVEQPIRYWAGKRMRGDKRRPEPEQEAPGRAMP